MLADEWKILTDDQKQQYYHEAERLKNLHQLQHPDYKYALRIQAIPSLDQSSIMGTLLSRYSPRARKNTKKGKGAAAATSQAPPSSPVFSPASITPRVIAPAPPLPRLAQQFPTTSAATAADAPPTLRIPTHNPTLAHQSHPLQGQQQMFSTLNLPQQQVAAMAAVAVSAQGTAPATTTMGGMTLPAQPIQVPIPLQIDPQRMAAVAAAATVAGQQQQQQHVDPQQRIIETIAID